MNTKCFHKHICPANPSQLFARQTQAWPILLEKPCGLSQLDRTLSCQGPVVLGSPGCLTVHQADAQGLTPRSFRFLQAGQGLWHCEQTFQGIRRNTSVQSAHQDLYLLLLMFILFGINFYFDIMSNLQKAFKNYTKPPQAP